MLLDFGREVINVMKEKPMLFSSPMVNAIIDGRKTMTRRLVKPQPVESWGMPSQPDYFHPCIEVKGMNDPGPLTFGSWTDDHHWKCPYEPGTTLWVKETFARLHDGLLQHLDPDPDNGEPFNNGWSTVYRVEGEPANWKHYGIHWKSPIFMPRKLSRITLEVKSVKVERLQDISRGDCMAEGCPFPNIAKETDPQRWYLELWESIHGKGAWEKNPFCWVIKFSVIKT